MANGDIAPPQEAFTTDGSYINPSWYRYLVQRKKIEDGITDSVVVTFGDERALYPNSKALTVAAGQLTETDNGATLELGLADTVAAGTIGDASHLVILAFDAKGRLTAKSVVALESGNVTETTKLFFTTARARNAVSGASGISYDSSTGIITLDQSFARGLLSGGSGINYNSSTGSIATTGFTGGPALYTSFTFVNGICTAAL